MSTKSDSSGVTNDDHAVIDAIANRLKNRHLIAGASSVTASKFGPASATEPNKPIVPRTAVATHETAMTDNKENFKPTQGMETAASVAQAITQTGPSLRGSADQLAEARKFSQAVTKGRGTSRSESRHRALPDRSITTSFSGRIQDAPRGSATPYVHKSLSHQVGTSKAAARAPVTKPAGVAHDTPFHTPQQSPVTTKSVSASASPTKKSAMASITRSCIENPNLVFKVEEDLISFEADPPAGSNGADSDPQEFLNKMDDADGRETVARIVAACEQAVARSELAQFTSGQSLSDPVSGHVDQGAIEISTKGAANGDGNRITNGNTTRNETGTASTNNITPAHDFPSSTGIGSSKANSNGNDNDTADNTLVKFNEDVVNALEARVAELEKNVFDMMKRYEKVMQFQEKRKFFGTDDAKTPFPLSVIYDNKESKIQVNNEMKVADVIRRARIAFDLSPYDSPSPRLWFEGWKLGHDVTLGELDIKSVDTVYLTCGEPDKNV